MRRTMPRRIAGFGGAGGAATGGGGAITCASFGGSAVTDEITGAVGAAVTGMSGGGT